MLLWLVDYTEDNDDAQENISETKLPTLNTAFPDFKLDSLQDDAIEFPIVENEEKKKFEQNL